ncbi:putative integral membrane protein [Leishmania donovani]|uniref:Putative integral membrane protein n=1 Tax=Leishmania donovani TaxID=5661 RepID=A0A504X0X0_LEIDO|nr:putative integral membrane protein [Leishmania donovani]
MADVALETSCTMTGVLVFTVTVPAGQNCPATATRPTDIPVSMFYQKLIWDEGPLLMRGERCSPPAFAELAKERLCDTTNANCIRATSAGFMDSAAVVPTSANLMERVRVKMAQAALKVMDTHAVDGGEASLALSDVAGATVDDVLRSYTATAARSASDRASTANYAMDLLLCAGASAAFIAAFYVWPCERRFVLSGMASLCAAARDPTVYVDRDSDEAIRRRTISFGMCCLVSGTYLAFGTAPPRTVQRQSTLLRPVIRSSVSTLLLFAGPIAEACHLGTFDTPESTFLLWRNYVICPIGEELNCEDKGVAGNDRDEKERACWRSAGHAMCGIFVFTALFGLLSGYYYEHVCERSIIAIAAAHALCNAIGPPEFTVLRSRHFTAREKVASAAIYVAGIVGWAWTLLRY